MKKHNFLTTLSVVLLIVTVFCGCANVDGEVPSVQTENISEQTSNFTEGSSTVSITNGKITVSTDERKEFPANCKIYMQKSKSFTDEQLLSFFSETPERTHYDETNTTIYTSDTECGNTQGTDLTFSTDTGLLCSMAYDSVGIVYDDGQIKDESLNFSTFDEVLEKVKKQMDELGFAPEEWFVNKIYTIKREDLEQFKDSQYSVAAENPFNLDESELQKEMEYAQKIKKYPSKDAYYIDIKFKIDDIHIYPERGLVYGRDAQYMILSSNCVMCYSQDGLEFISISNVCETEMSQDAEIISPDKAQELIRKKYNDIVFNGEVEVIDMALVYLPIPQDNLGEYRKNFETRPFYAFFCVQTEEYYGEAISKNIITYFDALTGNEFATEQIMAEF